MTTQLQQLKEDIEYGDSCIEAYEAVDIDQMIREGDEATAHMIVNVLDLVRAINSNAGVE